MLKDPIFFCRPIGIAPYYPHGPVVRVSGVCICCIFVYPYMLIMELLGDIISWLCPALPRHIIQTPWSISCEEGRWDPKMIVVFCFISWRRLPPKGPWFVWNDVKRKPVEDFSVVGKEANLRHRVFCGCFFSFGSVQHGLLLSSLGPEIPFCPF